MGRYLHRPEHGYKAVPQQSQITGPKKHILQGCSRIPVSKSRQRVEFLRGSQNSTFPPCIYGKQVAVIKNHITDKPPANTRQHNH